MRCRMWAWAWPGACSRRWRCRPGASRAMARAPSSARRGGPELARRGLCAGAVPAGRSEGYGKGALVGAAGELEHGALWHVPGGYAMRELLGWQAERSADARSAKGAKGTKDPQGARGRGQGANALAIVPATKKVGAPGCA